jgi:hypothetical protein
MRRPGRYVDFSHSGKNARSVRGRRAAAAERGLQ